MNTAKALGLLAAMLAACIAPDLWAYEEPSYEVVADIDGLEIRRYAPYLVAETVVSEDISRNEASNIGFRRLFDYITGDNVEQSQIDMTVPVSQQPRGRKIDMTVPVAQTPTTSGWTIAFTLPREFDAETAPRPTNPLVYIRSQPSQIRAVLSYSGRWTERNVETHKALLGDKLKKAGITPQGEIVVAFYNAPFSLPFLRRNEVMVQIGDLP